MSNELSTTTQPTSGWLTPQNMEAGLKLADMMAKAKLVPEHLRGSAADCLLVISQAARWGMDPFAVAQATAVVRGKLCYEGKLVAAVLTATNAIEGRLTYEFTGEGPGMAITITGTPKGQKPCTLKGSVAQWRTDNDNWKKDPQSMLVYRGTRQWARLYCPEAVLGVQTPDEQEEIRDVTSSATVRVPEAAPAKVREVAASTLASEQAEADAAACVATEAAAQRAEEERTAEPPPVNHKTIDALARRLAGQYKAPAIDGIKKINAKFGVAKLSDIPADKLEYVALELRDLERDLNEGT